METYQLQEVESLLHLAEALLELTEAIGDAGMAPSAICVALEHNAAAMRARLIEVLLRTQLDKASSAVERYQPAHQ